MDIGIIKGRTIGLNKTGDKQRVLLQVEVMGEDIRTVELMTQPGEDMNPANNCRVFILPLSDSYQIAIAGSDDLTPGLQPGEKEIYSTDNPVTTKKARLKFGTDEKLTVNQGLKNSVNWDDLNTQLQLLVTAINAALATKLNGSGSAGTLVLNLITAKCDKVLLP